MYPKEKREGSEVGPLISGQSGGPKRSGVLQSLT